MNAVLRLGAPTDAAAITRLVNLAYRVEDFFINGDRTTETEITELLATGQFILAEGPSGQLLGAVHVVADGPLGHFGMLAVDPPDQGRGLGSQLVREEESLARQVGCQELGLHVVSPRRELVPWYRGLGYVESGVEPFPVPENPRFPFHLIAMTKTLAPPRTEETT